MKLAIAGSALVQAYNALAGVLILPYYLTLLGSEAFGLIGVFLLIQSLVQLLDFGITPTFSRQVSLFVVGQKSISDVWSKVRLMEIIFALIAFALCGSVFIFRHSLASSWLSPSTLSPVIVGNCLFLMVAASCFRWQAGIYRGAVYGMERHTTFNLLTVLFTTLRFFLAIPVIIYSENALLSFFVLQLVVSALEIMVFFAITYTSLPGIFRRLKVQLTDLAETLSLASATGVLSIIWILSTNVDKIILSRVLALDAFGHFSLAVAAASAIFMGLPILNQVVQPRYTILVAQKNRDELLRLYRLTTQAIVATLATATTIIVFHGRTLLTIWIQDPLIADEVAPLLVWYTIANSLAVISAPIFLIQFAYGDLSLHIKGNIIFLCIAVPAMLIAAVQGGAISVAVTIAVCRMLFVLIWIPKVHQHFIPEIASKWLTNDLVLVYLTPICIVWLGSLCTYPGEDVYFRMVFITISALAALLAGLAAGGETRKIYELF